MRKKTVGIVGLGYWGKNILRNLAEMEVIHTACDQSPNVIAQWRKAYPKLDFVNDYRAVFESEDIDTVAIATPAETHYNLVKEALLAGKHVFVEKPLALTVQTGKELLELARKSNRILMVGHILQYHPAIIKLKQLITDGDLGKINYIYSNRLNIGKLRTEENILWSFAPHDISVMLMLLEEMPVRVSTFGGDYVSNGIYDTTMTTLEFTNGVKGHIFVSWLHPFKEQKLIVVGSKGMAVFDDLTEEKLLIYPHKIEWRDGKVPIAQKADYQTVEVSNEEPLKAELDHFLMCIQKNQEPKTDGSEGLRVLEVLEAMQSQLSNTPVPLRANSPEHEGAFVHSSSVVDKDVEIGTGTKIWHFSHILKNTRIGKNCVMGQNVMAGPNVQIGNNVKIQNNVSIYDGVVLEDDVFCGPSMVFTNVVNPRSFIVRKNEFKKTLVKRGASIGANATIICGTTIDEYALVAAGAVVNRDVPPFALVAGVPAKRIGWICKCGITLGKISDKHETCQACNRSYKLTKGQLEIVRDI